ncbi:MAG: hypothetical protein JRH15_09565 [Deltaproteobacteria bacterium]|nr:hypothetical protein [Deltaproteobacteria bacterium]
MHYVTGFVSTDIGPVPIVGTQTDKRDRMGTVLVRLGFRRNDYRISPGLYGVGHPDDASPVLVTANYKLTFDALRKELGGTDAWLLVIDTRGINVWCAASKGTFGTQEVVHRIKQVGLDRVVGHCELILPQLSATGVEARAVRKQSGFKVVWGPVRACDIKRFLEDGKSAQPPMRQVTFTINERMVLIPVEGSLAIKPILWAFLAIFILSGVGPDFFSFQMSWARTSVAMGMLAGGVLAGTVLTPLLLPWVPGRAFSLKGAIVGFITAILLMIFYQDGIFHLEALALILFSVAVSSFLAMNFTGTTPYTSPTGVEKEMRRAIPIQLATLGLSLIGWVGAGFLR